MRITKIAVPILLLATLSFAQAKVETAPSSPDAPEAIKSAVVANALRVTSGAKGLATVWAAKAITGEKNGSGDALYPELPKGAFSGVITFTAPAQDFRGQKIAAGTYTLRYAQLPGDGNHLGVAPNPDFFLLVPLALDTDPAVPIPYARLVKVSAKAAGTNHPAAFSLASAAKSVPSVEVNDKGHTILTFELSVNGAKLPVGFIVAGVAEQ